MTKMCIDYAKWHRENYMKTDYSANPGTFCNLYGSHYNLEEVKEFLDWKYNAKGEVASWSEDYRKDIEEYYRKRIHEDLILLWVK